MAGSPSDVNALREMLAARDQSKAPAVVVDTNQRSSVDNLQQLLGGSEVRPPVCRGWVR
jgi:hypothetical protein